MTHPCPLCHETAKACRCCEGDDSPDFDASLHRREPITADDERGDMIEHAADIARDESGLSKAMLSLTWARASIYAVMGR